MTVDALTQVFFWVKARICGPGRGTNGEPIPALGDVHSEVMFYPKSSQ